VGVLNSCNVSEWRIEWCKERLSYGGAKRKVIGLSKKK